MWDILKDGVYVVTKAFADVLGDWGLAIIILTVIFRLLITPLMYKQTKSTHDMNKIQPLMKSIQDRFKDDPARQQEEMQKLYAEAKFNPLAGCIPMLIQMPIFILLFQVFRELGTRGGKYSFYGIVPDLTMTPADAMGVGPMTFIPYLILMLIFAFATFIPMILQQRGSTDEKQKKQTYMMSIFMALFMLFISWTSPAAVLLFWGVSSLLAIAQQQGSLYSIKKKDREAEALKPVKPVIIDVERKEKKKRPTKKSK